jgi:non-homologous end joining protein Ku
MTGYFGVDTSTMMGQGKNLLDWTFGIMRDPYDMLLESVYRRVTTRQGIVSPPTGVFWDENTMDLRDHLNASLSSYELAALKSRIEALFDAELRYAVEATVSFGQNKLTVVLDVTPSDSDIAIRMVLTADSNQVTYERVS